VAFLELDDNAPDHIRDALRMIHRNVTLEARLIDDLLDLTRVSKGKIQLSMEVVDAHALLRSAVEICEADLKEKKLDLHVQLDAREHFVRGDSARLQQIFWNLLKNAVKFTPPSGKISVVTASNNDQLQVQVSDNGIGIELEVLPKIFNAFEQGARHRAGGLGLGLAITRALVDMHGGHISATSGGLDLGATFTVQFPAVEAPADDSEGGSDSSPAERLPLRLLIVEDHQDTRQSLTRLLERRGYEVQVAESIRSALDLVAGYDFDVLISDMGLPDGNGIDLMQELSLGRSVRGIALSGYGMDEDVQRSRAAGFSEHLTKPVDIHTLDAAIQRLGTGDGAEAEDQREPEESPTSAPA
jgi:two-component system CheB/CheR fusion protein